MPATPKRAVLRKLWINNARHIPVVQDGALVGILARDILLDVLREGRYYPGALISRHVVSWRESRDDLI